MNWVGTVVACFNGMRRHSGVGTERTTLLFWKIRVQMRFDPRSTRRPKDVLCGAECPTRRAANSVGAGREELSGFRSLFRAKYLDLLGRK